MLYAAVAACPVFGGSVKSFDGSAALKRRGVAHVLPVPNGVAVVADRFWRAKEALADVKIDWDYGAGAGTDIGRLRSRLSRRSRRRGRHRQGARATSPQAYGRGGKVLEAVYEAPHLAHAPMEPLNATAYRAAGSGRRLDGHAERRRRARSRGQDGRHEAGAGLCP